MTGDFTHPVWGQSLRALRRSAYADQIVASMVDEWRQSEDFGDAVATHQLVDTSKQTGYYRSTAIGHCIRLHFIPSTQADEVAVLLPSLVCALYLAQLADRTSKRALRAMPFPPTEGASWPDMVRFWHRERTVWLKVAANSLRSAIPADAWANGRQMALGLAN